MCDLYLSIYSATEPFLNTTSAAGSLSDSTSQGSPSPVVGRVLQGIVGDTGGTTKDVAGTSVEDLGNVSDVTVPPGTGSESEVVIALLGGALESLLESRFAFTPAVAERSRHSRQILSLADDVAKRLGSVLVKVLKAHTKGLLLSPNSPEQTLDANLLRQALQVSVKGPDDKAAISTVETSALGTAAAASMSMTGKGMVLEVRAVCSELLRWTVSMTPTPSSPTLSPPPISASNGTSTQPAGGGGGQGPGSIPVNRLYELIDTLNQNNWLRRHVIGNKKYT